MDTLTLSPSVPATKSATGSLLDCFEIVQRRIADTSCGKDMIAHRIAKNFKLIWIDIQAVSTFVTAN